MAISSAELHFWIAFFFVILPGIYLVGGIWSMYERWKQ